MAKYVRVLAAGLLVIAFAMSLFVTGCTRYANDKQMTSLEESQASASAANDQVAQLQKENADLKAQLAQKQGELNQVQAEKNKIKARLGQ